LGRFEGSFGRKISQTPVRERFHPFFAPQRSTLVFGKRPRRHNGNGNGNGQREPHSRQGVARGQAAKGSVSCCIDGLKAGDPSSARLLWDRFNERLLAVAKDHLAGVPRGAADEEDLALCVFHSVCRRAARNGFHRLDDRDDLWQLLVMITARKAANHYRHETAQKRGSGRVHVYAESDPGPMGFGKSCLDQIPSSEPTPALALEVADAWQQLLGRLRDQATRNVAVWKMDGYSNHEIAERLGRKEPTVRRKLRLIRLRMLDGEA